jgi:hypothetical protein
MPGCGAKRGLLFNLEHKATGSFALKVPAGLVACVYLEGARKRMRKAGDGMAVPARTVAHYEYTLAPRETQRDNLVGCRRALKL